MQWRARLTKDGVARFVTRAYMKNIMNYREVTDGATATASYVVLLDDPPPQFAIERPYVPPEPVDLVGDERLSAATQLGEVQARSYGKDQRVLTCTRAERDNPRLWSEIQQLAREKGLMVRFSP